MASGDLTRASTARESIPRISTTGASVGSASTPDLQQPLDDEAEVFGKLTETQVADFRAAFALFDPQGTKTMPAAELGNCMKACCHDPSDEEVEILIRQLDPKGTGFISRKTFIGFMAKRMEYVDEAEEVRMAFRVWDIEGMGFISAYDLKKYLISLGEKLTDEEADQFIKEADIHENGQIGYEDYVTTMELSLKK